MAKDMMKSGKLLEKLETIDLSRAVPFTENPRSPFYSYLVATGKVTGANAIEVSWREQEYGKEDSSAQLEGAGFVRDEGDRKPYSNLMEIFRKSAQISGTLNAITVEGIGNELQNELSMRMAEMKQDIDRKLITGTKSKGSGLKGNTMSGIMNLIHKDNVVTRKKLDFEALQKVFQKMFDVGYGGNKLCIISSDLMGQLNILAKNDATINLTMGETIYGLGVTRLVSSFGSADILIDPYVPKGTMIFVDPTYIEVPHLRQFQARELSSTTDSTEFGIVVELSLKYLAGKSGAVLKIDAVGVETP